MNRIKFPALAVGTLLMVALTLSACTDNASIVGPDRGDTQFVSPRGTPAAGHPTTIYWEGHGKEHIDSCTAGYHWIFAPGGGLTSAPQFFSSIPADNDVQMFRMSGSAGDNAAWHYNSGLVTTTEGVTPYVIVTGTPHPQAKLIISHCLDDEGASLAVAKTADATFDREHDWSIDKRVETENEHTKNGDPKIWLYTDGSGDEDATWYVDATYEGYEDDNFVIAGVITITNISSPAVPKEIVSIADDLGLLGYADVPLTCVDGNDNAVSAPGTIAPEDTWTCTYSVTLNDGDAADGDDGINTVTVVVQDDAFSPYTATDDWEFDGPENEKHRYANVSDENPGLADNYTAAQLALDAHDFMGCDGDACTTSYSYTDSFAFEDYEDCEGDRIDNTAEIRGDDDELLDSATATLRINVQCYIWDSAWAKGTDDVNQVVDFCTDADLGSNNWGWTNDIDANYDGRWPLWAGAGQCDTDKATHVGYFVLNGQGGFDFEYFPGVVGSGEAVFSGTEKYPQQRNNRFTAAPGQYSILTPLDQDVWVIAHSNVGHPDPDFGPQE